MTKTIVIIFTISCIGCTGLYHRSEKFSPEKGTSAWWCHVHYVRWKSASSELIDSLGENHKHDIKYAIESIENLENFKSLLTNDEKETLQPYIEKFRVITNKIQEKRLNEVEIYRIKRTVKYLKRSIEHICLSYRLQ